MDSAANIFIYIVSILSFKTYFFSNHSSINILQEMAESLHLPLINGYINVYCHDGSDDISHGYYSNIVTFMYYLLMFHLLEVRLVVS